MTEVAIDITPVPPAGGGLLMQARREEIARSSKDDYQAPNRLPLKWTRHPGGTVAFSVYDPLTGVFGSGADPRRALQDLSQAMREHREVLERQENLSPALKRQLDQLRRR
jgi:predicted RNase H-like HicB family nuclease